MDLPGMTLHKKDIQGLINPEQQQYQQVLQNKIIKAQEPQAQELPQKSQADVDEENEFRARAEQLYGPIKDQNPNFWKTDTYSKYMQDAEEHIKNIIGPEKAAKFENGDLDQQEQQQILDATKGLHPTDAKAIENVLEMTQKYGGDSE
jgi:hypothetical protein